ncbi:MAG: amylo-alpha-1,6-glucosidase [Candidatus Hinthialibacter antarcticus]|nr:amylo-alpha-1,6-glucosidase [Candidatus Hinthialibacter antarcticus]
MNLFTRLLTLLLLLSVSTSTFASSMSPTYAKAILEDERLDIVLKKAEEVLKSGATAGTSYGEVWIRDYATFIEIACRVRGAESIKDDLLIFFKFQGEDGNIIDGYIPVEKATGGYDYIESPLALEYRAHKNTVETDQETSLVQAVFLYVKSTGDRSILDETIGGKTVLDRMEFALDFLLTHRFTDKYGLLWGATTADWGDVQPGHPWGVVIDESTKYCVDVYDNAMFLTAIDNFIALLDDDAQRAEKWQAVRDQIAANLQKHLWDADNQKYYPHRYIDGSAFPDSFNENEIFYFGGTACAALAGALSQDELQQTLLQMKERQASCGAATLGLTMYPPYPDGYFKNPSMRPYSYQNGGDWTWFGGRMIQAMIQYGRVQEAYDELKPMLDRVIANDDFYEWYDIYNQPRGAKNYRGSAGVLGKSILMLRELADKQQAEAK